MSVYYPKKSFSAKMWDFGIKLLLALIATVICFIPAELWYAIYKFAAPVGFWQKFAILGAGIWVFGLFQIFGLIIWIFCLFYIALELK